MTSFSFWVNYHPDLALLNRHLTSNAVSSKLTLVCTLVTVQYVCGQSGMSKQVPQLLTNQHFASPRLQLSKYSLVLVFFVNQASRLKIKLAFSDMNKNVE